jgi:hypothetical protein
MNQNSTVYVDELMKEFARNTGLEPENSNPKRYLWTDAFAVCNYLELYNSTNNKVYLDIALRLVNQVHHILGKQRNDDPKTGWISGLNEETGEKHPTKGGLRIGKEINERMSEEPINERQEWDRDGQYYHYLTKWMHALNNTTRVTGDNKYVKWAFELAKSAHAGFTYLPEHGNRKRMYWKMSIDLTYPLVFSMGQHDPLDGFITYNEIKKGMKDFEDELSPDTNLENEIHEMKDICKGMGLTTDDPLGIGGLLSDANRITQLIISGVLKNIELLEIVLDSSILGLRSYMKSDPLKYPAEYRLAFRELGLSIGLKGFEIMVDLINKNPVLSQINSLQERINLFDEYLELGNNIEKFWMDKENRKTRNWMEHRDINTVMLATSLKPNGFLRI